MQRATRKTNFCKWMAEWEVERMVKLKRQPFAKWEVMTVHVLKGHGTERKEKEIWSKNLKKLFVFIFRIDTTLHVCLSLGSAKYFLKMAHAVERSVILIPEKNNDHR